VGFTISQIAAISDNFALGKDNKLLWHFSEDMKFFKLMTVGKAMIMGRKTFESFPRPLPGRHHIVISRSAESIKSIIPLIHYVQDIDAAVELGKKIVLKENLEKELMVCGGAEIYTQTLKICDILYLTRVKGDFAADTFYPSDFDKYFTLTMTRPSEAHPDELIYQTWGKNNAIAESLN
jgi:dihydrofolate reductase